jgi:hypothetical protein
MRYEHGVGQQNLVSGVDGIFQIKHYRLVPKTHRAENFLFTDTIKANAKTPTGT